MTLLSQIFDIYINVNITFAVTALLWMAIRFLAEKAGARLSYVYQLGFLNMLFAVMLLSPATAFACRELISAGVLPQSLSVNLADYAVSQFLRGAIALPAEDFHALLGLRGRVTAEVFALKSTVGTAVLAILAMGAVLIAGRLVSGLVRLSRLLASCHVWRKHGRVVLLLSDTALVPFSARGLRTHYVVIPTEFLARPEDLKLVLKHEFEHVRQGDVTWETGLEMLRPLFFWNPFYYLWKQEVERLRELACDQKVAAHSQVDPKAYCHCLMRAAQSGLRKRASADAVGVRSGMTAVALLEVSGNIFRRSPAKKLRCRVEALVGTDRTKPSAALAAAFAMPFVLAVFLTALSLQKPADWSQDRLMLSAIINLERLHSINTFGQGR